MIPCTRRGNLGRRTSADPAVSAILVRQSTKPVNSRVLLLPTSAARRVRARIKRIDDQQRTGTGQTTGRHVEAKRTTRKPPSGVGREHALDGILERKVEGLRREITNDVRRVTSPEGAEALLGAHTREAVVRYPRDRGTSIQT